MKWIVSYDEQWLVICEICGNGNAFKKLWGHLRMVHKVLTADYKREQWLNQTQSLMCKESVELARQRNKENRKKVVNENLIKWWENTRFKKWDKDRTKEKVSLQCFNKLKKLHTFNKRFQEKR